MAVTQQLARISSARMACASASAVALESIVAFHVVDNDAFADFDWSPRVLCWSLQAINETNFAELVENAFEGAQLLNTECQDGMPDYPVYSEIRLHRADEVKRIATGLSRLPIASMTRTLAAVRAAHPGRELPDDFPAYVQLHASALVHFYAAASAGDQVVVTWWD